jgi:hypothetical protein
MVDMLTILEAGMVDMLTNLEAGMVDMLTSWGRNGWYAD